MNYATGKQTASFELNEDAREAFQDLKGCEKLTIQIKKYRKKRSLDANAYYWVLVSKLGKVLDMANPEVHNIALIRYGQPWIIDGKSVFTTIPDTEDAENTVTAEKALTETEEKSRVIGEMVGYPEPS